MKFLRAGAYEYFYDMPITVEWQLTKNCNYRCSYCFFYGYGRKDPPPTAPYFTLEQGKAAVENIASLNRPWYDLIFTGGEPTLHPHMIDLIYLFHDALKDRLNDFLIITNGSRNKKLYEKLAEIAKKVNISMQISIHTDHVDMEHMLELVENLSKDVNLYFPLMFNPAKREEVHLIHDIMYEYRKRFPFTLSAETVRVNGALDPRYTPEDFAWQKEANNRFDALHNALKDKIPLPRKKRRTLHMFHDIEDNGERKIIETTNFSQSSRNGLQNFSGMYCIANTGNLRIDMNGLCRGMICYHDVHLCNIYEKGSLKAVRDKLIHAVQCPRNLCGCGTNNYIPKFSSLEEAAHFMEIYHAKQSALFDAAS